MVAAHGNNITAVTVMLLVRTSLLLFLLIFSGQCIRSANLFSVMQTGYSVSSSLPSIKCMQGCRSKQGKMEKSFLSFAATYPGWAPEGHGKQFLATFKAHPLQSTLQLSPELNWGLQGANPMLSALPPFAPHPSLSPVGGPMTGNPINLDAVMKSAKSNTWCTPINQEGKD